jgi:betaine-aldehyde dehydrogenase
MFGAFWTNGQICSATSRALVHSSIYDEFMRILCGLTESLRVGSPLDRNTQTGPLINPDQRDKVLGFIRRARAAGARVVAGGGVPQLPTELRQGYYVQPTVVEVSNPDMEIWREEIFGPVLAVMRFDTEESAIELANNTKYGFCAFDCRYAGTT